MTEERKSNLRVGIDATEVKPGLEGIKREVRSAAQDIKTSADGASKSISGIGDGGREASQKVEAGARSMIREIERVTAKTKTAEQGQAAYYAELGKLRGITSNALDPYIEKLRQAEAAQRSAAGGLGKMEISAKQTAAALRGVPAQFTDIITSLQGGQAPLTVLLQQGGQLKDMFGGAGNAAKALGGYVVGLVSPLTVAAAAVGAFGYAMTVVEADSRKLSNIGIAFQATGRAALLSADDIKGLRREMSLLPGVSKDAAGAVITEFARTRDIGGSMLKGLSLNINDFAVALGQDVPAAAKTLAKAFADPAKGAKELDDALGFLTSNQLLNIRAMVEAGDKAGAQKLMLEALTVATKGLAKEGTDLERATDSFSKKWTEAMGNIGDSAALRRANEVLAGIITSAGDAAVALSKMKMPDWMLMLPGGVGAGLKVATTALGAMYPSKDQAAPVAPSSAPVNWNGGKGQRTLGMSDLEVPLTMFGQPPAVGPLRIEYTPKASPVTPMGAPTPAPAITSKELDAQVKALDEANKSYKSQKSLVADINREIGQTTKTLQLVVAEDKANGLKTSPRQERLQEILDGQKEKLESALKKGGGAADAANAAVQAYKNADKEILRERKSFFDEMEGLAKAGKIGELDAIERSMEMEDVLYARRKANFEAEMANAKGKKNGEAEAMRVSGAMSAAEEEHEQTMARLRRESAVAVAKATDDLERMVAAEEKAARASSASLKGARDENAEIGLTGEALGKVRQARVEDAAAELERRASILGGTPEAERFNAALRQQAQDLRDLAKEKGYGDSARMVADYSKAVNESAAAIQYETSVMGLSSRERDVAIAKYRIEIDLAQRLAKIKADNPAPEDAGKVDKLSADARSAAAKDSDNAEKRIQLDEWKQTVQQYDGIFRQGFADMLNNGKDGWKSFTKSLATTFKTSVADAIYKQFAQPLVINLVGNMMGMGGGSNPMASLAGGGGNNLMGMASNAYSLYNSGSSLYTLGSQYLGGTMSGANALGSVYANAMGTGIDGLLATNAAFGTSAQSAIAANLAMEAGTAPALAAGTNAAGAAGAGGMGVMATGGIVAAIMLGVINMLGGMRSETMVGSGLRGTLGRPGESLTPWQEWREGGTLIDGSSFATHNPLEELDRQRAALKRQREMGNGDSEYALGLQAIITDLEKTTKGLATATAIQNTAIQKGYADYRKGVVGMADSLNLGSDAIKTFAHEVGAQDLNFQGLNPDEIAAKISATFGKAGDEMAQILIGRWDDVTTTITTTLKDGQLTQNSEPVFTTETTTSTKRTYIPSDFAKPGEKAIDTLTRLATSFNTMNSASDALGFGLHKGSLSLAAFADSFIEKFGGLEKFTQSTGLFLQNFYTGEERRQALLRSGAEKANALGLKGVTAASIEQLGRSGLRDFANSQAGDPDNYRDAIDLANFLSPAFEAIDAQTPVVSNLADEVDDLTQAFNNALQSLKQERGGLLAQLSRANGDEAGARTLEKDQFFSAIEKDGPLDPVRRKELETWYDGNVVLKDAIAARNEHNSLQDEMNSLTDTAAEALTRQRNALQESNRALFDNVQAVKLQKSIAQELPGVLDKYRTAPQRRQAQYDDVSKGLTDAGIGVTGNQLANASKNQFAQTAAAVYNLGTTTDGMRLALVRAAGVMADIKDAEIDEAFAALQRAVDLQMETATKARDEIKAVFELLQSSVSELYGEVESTAKAAAAQGVDFITQALSTAQKTGYLPEVKELTKAISDARSGLNGTQYASQFERDKDRLVLAGKLSDLEDIGGDQLTEAERQVDALENIVKDAQTQINELRGINTGVDSVGKAVQALADAINGKNNAATSRPTNVITGTGHASFDKNTGAGTNKAGVQFDRDELVRAAQETLAANPNVAGALSVYDALSAGGYSLAQYNDMFGMPPGTLEKEAQALGRPIFHDGTTFVPETGYALLQRGEAVFPTAHNPFINGRGLGGDTSRLEAQLARLTAEVQRLQGLQEVGNTHAEATATVLDNVTEGGNGMRAEIMNKVVVAA